MDSPAILIGMVGLAMAAVAGMISIAMRMTNVSVVQSTTKSPVFMGKSFGPLLASHDVRLDMQCVPGSVTLTWTSKNQDQMVALAEMGLCLMQEKDALEQSPPTGEHQEDSTTGYWRAA